MTLVERISAAFPAIPVPREPLVEPSYLNPASQGDEGATAFFSGRSWPEVAPLARYLSYHRAAMYMFTPAVHAYYLPAFMVACISQPDEADPIFEDLLFHLASHAQPFWRDRVLALTEEQRSVIASFVEALADEFDHDNLQAAVAGLRASAAGHA